MSEPAASIREELRRRARERSRLRLWRAEVVETSQLTPRVRRITVAGDELRELGIDALPADGFKLAIPAVPGQPLPELRLGLRGVDVVDGGAAPSWRSYTVRRHDPATTRTDIDLVLHDAGPGAAWAAAVQVGDEVVGHGPRSDFYAPPGITRHLLVGDDTAVPAIAAIVESLPAGVAVQVLLEVQDDAERVEFSGPAEVSVQWLVRGDTPPGRSGLLAQAVAALDDLPAADDPDIQAWCGAESAAVREIRRLLLRERGLPNRQVHAVGFWRLGHAGGTE